MPSRKLVSGVIAAIAGTVGAMYVENKREHNRVDLLNSHYYWEIAWGRAARHHGLYPTDDSDHVLAGLKAGLTPTHFGLVLDDAREEALAYLRGHTRVTKGAWGLFCPTEYMNSRGYSDAFEVAVCTAPMMAGEWMNNEYCNQTMKGIGFNWGVVAAVLASKNDTLCLDVIDYCFNASHLKPWTQRMVDELKAGLKKELADVESVVDDKGKQTVRNLRSRWKL
jgi:hypothetical protein